jgi:hypothetical protein
LCFGKLRSYTKKSNEEILSKIARLLLKKQNFAARILRNFYFPLDLLTKDFKKDNMLSRVSLRIILLLNALMLIKKNSATQNIPVLLREKKI